MKFVLVLTIAIVSAAACSQTEQRQGAEPKQGGASAPHQRSDPQPTPPPAAAPATSPATTPVQGTAGQQSAPQVAAAPPGSMAAPPPTPAAGTPSASAASPAPEASYLPGPDSSRGHDSGWNIAQRESVEHARVEQEYRRRSGQRSAGASRRRFRKNGASGGH